MRRAGCIFQQNNDDKSGSERVREQEHRGRRKGKKTRHTELSLKFHLFRQYSVFYNLHSPANMLS